MIEVQAAKCTGCRLCEFACSFAKEGYYNPEKSRIKIRRWSKEAIAIPLLCMKCNDHRCIRECPTKALSWDDTKGIVLLDSRLCKNSKKGVRCFICEKSCPFEGCHIPSQGYSVDPPLLCDQCGGDPECIKVCFPGAIINLEESPPPSIPGSGNKFSEDIKNSIITARRKS